MDEREDTFAVTESERLAALADLAILDTGPEREFDAITRAAAAIFGVRSAAVSLIDRDRQWLKSRHCVDFSETPRDIAFCDEVVTQRGVIVVGDTFQDEQFCNNPLVIGDPKIRFYAGAPLFLRSGHCIGSLCILDGCPKSDFGETEKRLLQGLASVVEELIEARKERSQAHIAAEVVASAPDAVLAANRAAEIVYWNEAAERMFGWKAEEALGRNVNLIIPDSLRGGHQDRFEGAAGGGPTRLIGKFVELEAKHKGGSIFPVELSLASWGDTTQGGFAAVIRDITERKALQAERDGNKKFLDAVVSNLPSMLFVKDASTHRYVLLNRKAEEITGRSAQSMIGRCDRELFPSLGATFEKNDRKAIASGRPEEAETEFERDDGSKVNIRTTRILIDGPDRPDQYLLGLSENVTEMRQTEAARWKLARYDTLTGLLNRTSFLEQVDELIDSGTRFAILNVDLDRFKSVNDQFGHVTGDEVLKLLGSRLSSISDDDTHVARIGGDEFVCLITGERLRERALTISREIIDDIRTPIEIGGITAYVGASVGVVVHPDDGENLETLRQHADLAMYRAKLERNDEPCFFDDEMDATERDRRKLETSLRAAVKEKSVFLAFQPIIEVPSGKVTSFEALARWVDPGQGPVAPDVFISLAEHCGLIDELGEHILRMACEVAKGWPEHVRVAVNLSPRQFFSGRLVEIVLGVLSETGLPPSRLQLEITENLVIENADEAFHQLSALKLRGIQISIDDFGIGYSSLSYFQNFDFDKVKIDKSFIAEIETSRAAKAIVTAVVGLAQQLSMKVVAEGVETASQANLLRQLGVNHLQGYLYAAPLTSDEVGAYLSERTTSLSA